MLREELEILTGKLTNGDLTPLVYELVKDSPYHEDLLKYKSLVNKKIKKEEKVKEEEEVTQAPDFDKWLRRFL